MLQNLTAKLTDKEVVAPGIWLLTFTMEDPKTFDFEAGQYVILKIIDRGQRNYSICSPDLNKKAFQLIIQIVPDGLASSYIAEAVIGDLFSFRGPAGVFILKKTPANKIFLATGTGIAPIRSIINSSLNSDPKKIAEKTSVTLFWGLRTKKDFYLIEELEELAATNPNFRFFVCLSKERDYYPDDPTYFRKGRMNEYVKEIITDPGNNFTFNEYYICGNRYVVDSLTQFLNGLGVPLSQIVFEKFV